MKILVNARFFGAPFQEAKFRFLMGNLMQISRFTSFEGILIFTDLSDPEQLISGDIQSVSKILKIEKVFQRKPSFWNMKYWYDFQLKSRTAKYKPDLIIHGDHFCSFTLSFPQIMLGDDILWSYLKEASVWNRWMFAKRWGRMISKATGILGWSDHVNEKYNRKEKNRRKQIFVAEMLPFQTIQSINWEEKQEILLKQTAGVTYFLAVMEGLADSKQFLDLLKGFSWFKKRFQSRMKLMVFGVRHQKWLNMIPLESYKHRDDVIFCNSVQYLEALSACYAMFYISGSVHMPLSMLEAFQFGVPVVAKNDPLSATLAFDAVCWNEDPDPEHWGRIMGELYKNESYRNELINRGYKLIESKPAPNWKAMLIWFQDLTKSTFRTFAAL